MSRQDLLRWAAEADAHADKVLSPGEFHPDRHEVRDEKFAQLVAEQERERCAQLILKKLRQLDVPVEQAWGLTLIVQDWLAE